MIEQYTMNFEKETKLKNKKNAIRELNETLKQTMGS